MNSLNKEQLLLEEEKFVNQYSMPNWLSTEPRGRQEVFLKEEPPRWKFWAGPKYHNVSWFYRELSDPSFDTAVRKNPHLYYPVDVVIERIAGRRGSTIEKALETLYDRKHRMGPGPWFDTAVFGLAVVLGTITFLY